MSTYHALLSQLHRALAHLDDPPYLEKLSLIHRASLVGQSPDLSRGQALRRALRMAIASLDPGVNTGQSTLDARSYQVLYRYAVAKQGMVSIAGELGISTRQAYRELHSAIEALAEIVNGSALVPDQGRADGAEPAPFPAAQVSAELRRLAGDSEQVVDLIQLVAEAVESAQRLAEERQVALEFTTEASSLHAAANRVIYRQAILNLLSHMLSAQQGQQVLVTLCSAGGKALLRCRYHPQDLSDLQNPKGPYAVAQQLFASLGIHWLEEAIDEQTTQITVPIPLARERTLLIIDDNEGLVALFKSFLRHQPYCVYSAGNGRDAIGIMDRLRPDIVILDVMMPDRDGWEVLQAIRARESSRQTKVIVCSIIDDPKLSMALGADYFLNKPVDRTRLLQALDRVAALGT